MDSWLLFLLMDFIDHEKCEFVKGKEEKMAPFGMINLWKC